MQPPPGRWISALLIAMLWGLPVAQARPVEVILLRHGDKDNKRGDYNLSPAGFQRSIALARLIPACFGKPTVITTFYLDPDTSKNARSYQSAVPLGVATGVNIRMAPASLTNSLGVGEELRRRTVEGSGESSERVVLFWEHRRMPELARGLGWPAMPAIADDDFDQMFVFRFPTPGGEPEVQRLSQSALFRQACYRKAEVPWQLEPAGATTAQQP
ncbi:hypothetical protein NZK27_05775 [Synechococcus sp. FGCU-3]|nr:hypothetical protein [Synechococcus sp. FGCU3]